MTLWAQREQGSEHVEVNGTQGSISVKVTEHYMHLRSFWGQLGNILDQAEAEQKASVTE